MSSSDKNTLCLITMSLAEEAGMLQYCSPAVTERSTYRAHRNKPRAVSVFTKKQHKGWDKESGMIWWPGSAVN